MSDYNRNAIIQAYDSYAAERDEAGLDDRKIKHIDEAVDFFRTAGAKTVLEIGSGPGIAAQRLKESGLSVECIDISPKMIELVRHKGIHGTVMDSRDVESIGKQFDAIFSVNSLLHIPLAELSSVLNSICHVLNPEGVFALGLWGGDDQEGIYEKDRYEPKRFFSLLSQKTLLSTLCEMYRLEQYQCIDFDEGMFFHKVFLKKGSE